MRSVDVHLSLTDMSTTARCRWDRPVTTIQINGLPLSLAFHAFDPHLVIANESDMVTYVYIMIVHVRKVVTILMGVFSKRMGLDQAPTSEPFLQRKSSGN